MNEMIEVLTGILTRLGESGDPAELLGDDAFEQADRALNVLVAEQGRSGQVETRAVHVLAALHWNRYQFAPDPDAAVTDLDRAVSLFSVLLPVAPQAVPAPVKRLLGAADEDAVEDPLERSADLLEAYERTGRPELLDAGVALLDGILAEAAGDGEVQAMALFNLAYALLQRFHERHRDDDLDRSIVVARRAVSAERLRDADRAMAMSHLGNALQLRHGRTGEPADLDEAIGLLRRAVETAGAATRDRAMCLGNLGNALHERFRRTGDFADLDEAVRAGREALDGHAEDDFFRPAALSNLGAKLHTRFERTGDRDDLLAAVAANQEAVAISDPADPYFPVRQHNLASVLHTLFELDGRPELRQRATEMARQAAANVPAGHPQHALAVDKLAALLVAQFEAESDLAVLDEAIRLHRQAIASALDDPERARYRSDLAIALRHRFRWGNAPGDLDEAVAVARQSVDEPRSDPAERSVHLGNLGTMLFDRFQQTGRRADLDEAIAAMGQSLDGSAAGATAYVRNQMNYGAMLNRRFELTRSPSDVDQAVAVLRECADQTPAGHPELAERRSMLGVALADRFELTGADADLDAGIEQGRRSVEAAPAGRPGAVLRSNYALLLLRRFRWSRQLADLETALGALGPAVEEIPAGHPNLTTILTTRAELLHGRFEITGDPADLELAISDDRASLAATTPGTPDHRARRINLGIELRTRFALTGDRADIDEAVAVSQAAADTIEADDPAGAAARSSLGYALRIRFEATGDLADIDAAIAVTEQAVAQSVAETAGWAGMQSNLGIAYWSRYRRTGRIEDLRRAASLRRAAAGVPASPARSRLLAAAAWGQWSLAAGDVAAALEGYNYAIDLLPRAAWHGLDDRTRQAQLAELQGLTSAAAYCAIAAEQPERAVELLEQGRSIIWTQALRLRGELTALAERAPALAERLEQARQELDQVPVDEADDSALRLREAADERRRRAARAFDEVLDEIRQLDGFANFFRPTPFAELGAAAAGGPVVILNTSEHGSHALIVRRADAGATVDVVPLPGAAAAEALGRVNGFRQLLARARQPKQGFLDRERDRHATFDLLEWLWSAVTEPVLARIGVTGVPDEGSPLPRVWWCPATLWTMLPLHAAGRHPRNRAGSADPRETSDGRVISSYTPTLAALIRARSASPAGPPRLLAVGVPEAPGADPLPGVDEELAVIDRHFPASGRVRQLRGDEATRANVKAALADYDWTHFACHGYQDPDDPVRSALLLQDGPLTVGDLVQLRHDRAELAFLSACETTTGDTRLLDEAVHLAAAFRLLGYRHVIAGQWHLADAPAPAVADAVYARLTDAGAAGPALHRAVRQLRANYPDRPLVWAPYTHSGP